MPKGIKHLCLYRLNTLNNSISRFIHPLLLISLMLSLPAWGDENYTVGLAVWSGYEDSVKGFKAGMHQAGLKEGHNVTYLQGESVADKKIQTAVAKRFLEEKVDLVYSLTTPGTSIMKNTLPKDLPIIFSIVTYPADSGLIESFDYSGNNLVGTSNYVPLSNYITLLNLVLPDTKTAAIIHRKGEPNSNIQAANLIRLLKRQKIKVLNLEPSNIEELVELASANAEKVDLFITTTDTLLQGGGEQALIEVSIASQTPILSSNKQGIEAGSTFGPVADFYILGEMAGQKAAQVLLQNMAPTQIKSEVQNPPLFLANPRSIAAVGLTLPLDARQRLTLTED
ncbi:ABC transporter substrate-binding protein [Shewanella eurypsychrophilus]|uniref:ABC transporter substrate-binding protein n=1 Tax=Shewanella eurypsychrophilus TaxID=2593656 RepID=A0ABX6V0L7_9GAMM|nr:MULTISPECIES: ABC transporter substrate-binding protein [Shewanella]QPG56128.2 ABC transporter substrate-binding protein [Shewanella eurypsychrophilus]